MQRVRRLLTEILLSVTTTEMYAIAEEVIKKEKLKGIYQYFINVNKILCNCNLSM